MRFLPVRTLFEPVPFRSGQRRAAIKFLLSFIWPRSRSGRKNIPVYDRASPNSELSFQIIPVYYRRLRTKYMYIFLLYPRTTSPLTGIYYGIQREPFAYSLKYDLRSATLYYTSRRKKRNFDFLLGTLTYTDRNIVYSNMRLLIENS